MPKYTAVKLKFKKLNGRHFYDTRVENRATRNENMVKLCKSIICNLAVFLFNLKKLKPSQKRSPHQNTH